jgi:hypothetical protein
MKYRLISSLSVIGGLLTGCAGGGVNVASSMGGIGSAVQAASPVLTVISVSATAVDILTSGQREYRVKIRSTDTDRNSALRQAFQEACSVTFGSTVASELESNQGRLTRDNVVSYTGCYVKNQVIESQSREPNGEVTVLATITVASNKLSGRLLGNSSHDQSFNGEQHADRISTFQTAMSGGDQLIDTVMKDFPSRAYKLDIAKIRTMTNRDRSGFILIDYLIQLDPNYYKALENLFAVTGKIPAGKIMGVYPAGKWGVNNPVAEIRVPGFMSMNTYQFSDQITVDKISAGLNRPQMMKIYAEFGGEYSHLNANGWKLIGCVPAAWSRDTKMIDISSRGGSISDKKVWYQFRLDYRTPQELDTLRNITNLKLSVTGDNC